MKDWLVQILGWVLVAAALVDLYLTVLYARSDVGLLSPQVNRLVWRGFRGVAKRLPWGGQRLLTFAGPTLLAMIVLVWLGLLVIGFALIVWPALADEIRKSSGQTPTDFGTAFYYSGYTLATLGFGDIVPQTAFWRVLAVVESLLGFSVLTLSLTYFMSVYSALVRRNALALTLYHRSGRTDDAAELLARLGAGGSLDRTSALALEDLNLRLHDLFESHHSYPILHYFNFVAPHYAMANIIAMLADTATLARTAVDPNEYHEFVHSAEVEEMLSASAAALDQLSALFLPSSFRPGDAGPEVEAVDAWRRRFRQAVERLRKTEIAVTGDLDAAAQRYVEFRSRWSSHSDAFRRYMLTESPPEAGSAE